MNDTKFTLLPLDDNLREQRVGHGICSVNGECYICGTRIEGMYELQESMRTIFRLCGKCKHEAENVRITLAARYGWIYMHSWNGLIAKIKRSSGAVHNAKIIAIESASENGDEIKYPMFRCIWNEPKDDNGHTIPDRQYLMDYYYKDYATRLVTYKTLMELNPDLVDLHSVKQINNIPIHESYQNMTDELIKCMKTGSPTTYSKNVHDFRDQYIADGKAILGVVFVSS